MELCSSSMVRMHGLQLKPTNQPTNQLAPISLPAWLGYQAPSSGPEERQPLQSGTFHTAPALVPASIRTQLLSLHSLTSPCAVRLLMYQALRCTQHNKHVSVICGMRQARHVVITHNRQHAIYYHAASNACTRHMDRNTCVLAWSHTVITIALN